MDSLSREMPSKLRPVFTVILRSYVDAILSLHEKLGNINWIIIGDLAECLRTAQVKPDGIGILCDKHDLEKAFASVKEYNPTGIALVTDRLPRNAFVDGKEYPLFVRSRQFWFTINGVNVRIEGDKQFRVGEWDWGDPLEFTPEYVNVIGKKTAVMPLSLAAEIYRGLGWSDRLERIKCLIQKPLFQK
jgi:hypothetical protein